MIEILIGVIALFFVLALVIISRNKYTQWLERKLAMARKELSYLRKRTKALEAHVPESVLRRLDAQIK